MSTKRILGIICVIAGVALLCISGYIKSQVGQGSEQVAAAQKKLDQGNSLFSLNSTTKQIGQGMTSGANKKIASAKEQIAYYQNLAEQLQMGGILLIVVGGIVLIFSRKKRK
jgi:hypothetical protein